MSVERLKPVDHLTRERGDRGSAPLAGAGKVTMRMDKKPSQWGDRYEWKIWATTTTRGRYVTTIVNGQRDTGAALEVTSETHVLNSYGAAIEKVATVARSRGCRYFTIDQEPVFARL